MHPAPVDSPPRPRLARATAVLAALSALLLIAVATRWEPLMSLDGELARTVHRWAVDDPRTDAGEPGSDGLVLGSVGDARPVRRGRRLACMET